MNCFKPSTGARWIALAIPGVMALAFTFPLVSDAQDKSGKPAASDASKDLALQLEELRAKVAKLEAALDKNHPGKPSGMSGMTTDKSKGMGDKGMGMGDKGMGMPMGMGGMEGTDSDEMMQMMQMMGKMMQMMGGRQGKGMGGMAGMGGKGGMSMEDDDMEMMGMMGMGNMGGKGMGKMKMAAALPGFPGASHIYHIGATGFFLDHPEHITLTTKQQTTLNGFKQKALTAKASSKRKIDEAEQELWELTGSDQPDAAKIEAKVLAIEKLRSEQRMAFIRAIGEAAKVLSDEQRQVLLGQVEPKIDKPADHSKH